MPVHLPFKTQGHGPDLILLHGYAGRPQSLQILIENLCPYFRVIVPDLNELYFNRKTWGFAQQVDILNEWIRARVHRPHFDILGLSYGGALGWGLSLSHPDLVNKLIMVNPMTPYPFQSLRNPAMRFFLGLPSWGPLSYSFLNTYFGRSFLLSAKEIFRDSRLESMNVETLRGRKLAFVAGLINQFSWILNREHWAYWQDKLSENTKQSLLIYDPEDPLFNEKSYQIFGQRFGVQERFRMEGVGHIPHPENYSLIADSVISFLIREKLEMRLA